MKKCNKGFTRLYTILLVGAIVFPFTSCSEESFDPNRTRVFDIESQINGAKYIIRVALPSDFNTSTTKYPAVYVLDGEQDFDLVANQCAEISARNDIQNVLVVSICYGNDRSLDYTPTSVSNSTGGGPKFIQFIKTELIPKMEADFNAGTDRSDRVIIGHSYGGLLGAYALVAENDVFGNYLLLSPSLWFDNEVTLVDELKHRDINKDKQQLVFLGIGELENSGRMQAPFEAFYQALSDNYRNTVLSKHREMKLDHVGSKNPNIIKSLEFYFQNR